MRSRPSARHLKLFFLLLFGGWAVIVIIVRLVYALNVCEIPKPTRISVVRHLTFIDFIQALPAKRHIKCNFHIVNIHAAIICSALFPVTNIELLNATITITHDILSSVWCFLRALFFAQFIIFAVATAELPLCCWRIYLNQLETEDAEKNSHQYRWLFFVCFLLLGCFHRKMTYAQVDRMVVSVAFNKVFKINGKNDIFKCIYHHFALVFFSKYFFLGLRICFAVKW